MTSPNPKYQSVLPTMSNTSSSSSSSSSSRRTYHVSLCFFTACVILLSTYMIYFSNQSSHHSVSITSTTSPSKQLNKYLPSTLPILPSSENRIENNIYNHEYHLNYMNQPVPRIVNNPVAPYTCEFPVVTLTSATHCRATYVLYQSLVRVTQMEGYTSCLILLYRNDTAKATNQIDIDHWEPVVDPPYQDSPYCAAMHNDSLTTGVSTIWYSMPPLDYPEWISLPGTSWAYSFMKYHAFGLIKYNRVLFVDADFVFVRELDKIFYDAPLSSMLVGIPDQADGCNGRNSMNGGFVIIQPSKYIHTAAVQCVDDKRCSCLGGTWRLFDQEMMMCWCGYATGQAPLRPDIPCSLLPVYNSVWPLVWWCKDITAAPTRTLHYMGDSKPWEGSVGSDGSKERRTDTWSQFWWCIHDSTFGVVDQQSKWKLLSNCSTDFHY